MLREAEFFKNRKIRIVLCLELILILIGVAGILFGKRGIVAGTEETQRLLKTGVPLQAGVYTARLYYEAEQDGISDFGVTAEVTSFRGLKCNYVPLYKGIHVRECQFYLSENVESLRVDVRDNGAPGFRILGVELETGTERSRMYLFWVILFSLVLDGILLLALYHRKHPIPADRQLAVFGVPALALAASLPVMVDYNMIGADLVYHIMRIEALAESIRRGELLTRIGSVWLAGHGYATSVFYGDTFLLIPALFRIVGFSPDSAYRMYVVTVNLATAWIAYVSFRKCFRSRWVGMFGCVLYTLQPYRIYNIYNRAAVGEYTAMIFLPLLAWGFYGIYTEDTNRKGYLWNWVIPTIGFTGIIQSHALSCEMAGLLVIALCLILWKKTFRPRTFGVLALTVIMTAAVNAWFLTPFLDLMTADRYYFGHNANVMVQNRGILPAHLFYTLQAAGASSRFAETGMVDTEPVGIGAALLLCLILWAALCLRQGKKELTKEQRTERKAANTALGLGCAVLLISTCYFPWDYLSSLNRLFATLNGSLQFPTRLTSVAGICMVMTGCVMAVWVLRETKNGVKGAALLISVAAVSVIFGSYQLNDTLLTRDEFVRIYTAQGMGHSAVLGAEYLPEGAVMEHMTYHAPVLSEGVALEAYEKDGLTARCRVEAEGDGWIEFPMLYYKGYEARVAETGEKLSVVKGDNTDVRVLFPEGFSGEITVRYAGMWYWHAAEVVSILTVAAVLIWYGLTKGKKSVLRRNKTC